MVISNFIIGISLLFASIEDVLKKTISKFSIAVIIIAGIGYMVETGVCFVMSAGGLVMGLILVGISLTTKQAFGMADAVILLILGISMGLGNSISVLMIALFIVCGYSGIMLLLKKVNKKSQVPFLPFLFIGYIASVLN